MKKILSFIVLACICNVFFAQESNSINTFYVNVFINHNKDIRIESNLVETDDIGNEVKNIVYNHSFKVDEKVVYRIYTDKDVDLGYIMDTEQKMIEAYSYNVKRERYLLETEKTNIDGSNWFEKLDRFEIKPVGRG
ncbi:hypothetical protein [Xanthomarina sp. F2636L]|uniref:hypothetical protein n=1 Tax=Xanthomarina sp. F2636L TaxID=2996018 RepID=UPI00225DEE65|nr:hypothetical protein [Xanthomarina sp. F2636L]MCX7549900.1 hypothetical protein [Xanthomarina sp. F2636L]